MNGAECWVFYVRQSPIGEGCLVVPDVAYGAQADFHLRVAAQLAGEFNTQMARWVGVQRRFFFTERLHRWVGWPQRWPTDSYQIV